MIYNYSSLFRPKSWLEELKTPQLDYSDFFPDDLGQDEGLDVWQIENFVPLIIDEGKDDIM